jgi:hypothetical protein
MLHTRCVRTTLIAAACFTVLWLIAPSLATACPFCQAVGPTLVQQIESADIAVLAVVDSVGPGDPPLAQLTVQLRLSESGDSVGTQLLAPISVDQKETPQPGTLVLALAKQNSAGDMSWRLIALDEAAYAYLARAPGLRKPSRERLAYFVRFLEHPNPVIADDAYLEFAHAPFDQVAEVADQLPQDRLRTWLDDPRVRPERKGFYGMALGLATQPADQQQNRDLLRKIIDTPASDFRSGYDGALGGYLWLAPNDALDLITARYLADPQAPVGDVRHAISALRFYREFGQVLSDEQIDRAYQHLLDRHDFAADAIVDLARWQCAAALPQIQSLYARSDYPQPTTRRAVVGYLQALANQGGSRALATLRQSDPAGVQDALRYLDRFRGE